MKTEIAKAIALLTTEYDLPPFSPDRIEMWMKALCKFPRGSVTLSAENFMRTSRFKPQLADIVTGCQVQVAGWLTADEAWARVPKFESESAMMTTEISQALSSASPLLAEGDTTAARMAFKATYTRLVDLAKIENRLPKFFPSFGSDKGGYASMLVEAVRAGQIGLDHAIGPEPNAAHQLIAAAGVTDHPLLTGPSSYGQKQVAALLANLRLGQAVPDEAGQ